MNHTSFSSKMLVMALLLMVGTTDVSAQGFLKNLKDKAVEKVKEKVTDKVEREVSDAADAVLDGKKKDKKSKDNDASEKESSNKSQKDETPETNTTNAKSDFVRGSKVLFQDELKGEQVGEFPSKWDLMDGNCEVAKIGDTFCLSLPPATTEDEDNWSSVRPLMKDVKNYLPDVFTLEFDYFVYNNSDNCNEIKLCLMSSEDANNLWLDLNTNEGSKSGALRYDARKRADSDDKVDGNCSYKLTPNAWNHVALSFNKRALKVYINGVRVVNVPQMAAPNWFYLESGQKYLGNGVMNRKGTQFTNFVLAAGAVELYDRNKTDLDAVAKAMEETGKFVTNNILFETGKADLKAESMAEIQKVADYMLKNKSVRFEVQGHTDNQGTDKVNDPLSQKRAEAIVAALVKLGVDEWNLRAVGKGSHEPVADNKTEEGRAKNRRVEFIKK